MNTYIYIHTHTRTHTYTHTIQIYKGFNSSELFQISCAYEIENMHHR